MKARMLFAIALVLAAAAAAPAGENGGRKYFSSETRYQYTDIAKAERCFVRCLDSENDGVVESAIAHLAKMKLAVPSAHCLKAERRLEALAANGRTATIRYKAYLAASIFSDPGLFASERKGEYNDGDELLAAIAGRLEESLLTYNAE